MFVLGLLICIVLRAFSAQAKVVTSFNECSEFFYQNKEPEGIDQNAKKICQMYEQGGSYYATLYSVSHRIPLYSAYTFDPDCTSDSGRKNDWHVERQISQPQHHTDHMVLEKDLSDNEKIIIKRYQAISSDYSDTGYDQGHLNPNSFSCGDGRKATFTLTNAAPMDACFNRVPWKNWEGTLRKFLNDRLNVDKKVIDNSDVDSDDDQQTTDTTIYIVTGTVPNANLRIPQREISNDPDRVTVPSHIWTAVCYKHPSEEKSFSFGYMGENKPAEPGISLMSVFTLNEKLSRLYSELSGTQQSIKIFDDECYGDNNKLETVRNVFKKLIDLPGNQRLQMTPDAHNIYNTLKRTKNSDISNDNIKLSKLTAQLTFDSMSTFCSVVEHLKGYGSACLIIRAVKLVKNFFHDELRKREISEGSDAVECLLVPEKQKTAADGSQCSRISDSSDSCQCYTEGETKPCCSSPCLYQGNLKSYRCYSGQTPIECSPRYSLITYKGERCKDDHPCATYGKDYYWCNTIYNTWDYCSPPLWRSKAKNGQHCHSNHACAKYNAKYLWCYTDDKGNYDQCCTSDDCHSAVNGQTCRSNHLCGKHGEDYLWCYTDYEDNWDYCCTNCSQ
ncbi:uncharacterized protein LOC125254251 [Megalobrama amblycephala]|uniref:uncharacterized protein LOC125254251 n=1 Tax=Megalobrama amblycephala TaxID=75352 RepID=UPI002013D439|nr:uncharacterized protein LOC125254251 [Megalobrama amblycephala]